MVFLRLYYVEGVVAEDNPITYIEQIAMPPWPTAMPPWPTAMRHVLTSS